MKRLDNGTWVQFETPVGDVTFKDANGQHTASVYTDGEFWRVVEVILPKHGSLTPAAALELSKLIAKGAQIARDEDERLEAQEKRFGAGW